MVLSYSVAIVVGRVFVMEDHYQMAQSLLQMQSAFDHFNEARSTRKMTTGSAELDSLIDSIHEDQFYLFYGKNKAILDGLVHGFLVNCVSSKGQAWF